MSDRLGHEEGLKAIMVDRDNPDNPEGRSLMRASTAHAIIKAGTAVDMMAAVGFTRDSLAAYIFLLHEFSVFKLLFFSPKLRLKTRNRE